MSTSQGTFNFPANFNRQIAAPLDGTLQVDTYAQLLDVNYIPYPYLYMQVSVLSNSDTTKNGVYYCVNPSNITLSTSWKLLYTIAGLSNTPIPNNGIVSGLTLTIDGTNVDVGLGSWIISGTTYTTAGLALPISTQDATLSRYQTVYADNAGTIHIATGILSATPTPPDIPDGTIPVGDILITPTSITTTPPQNGVVLLTTNQKINGIKTFTQSPLIPIPVKTTAAVPLGYLQTNYLKLSGGNLAGTLNIGVTGGTSLNISAGTSYFAGDINITGAHNYYLNGSALITQSQGDARYLQLAGGTLTGDVQQATNPINGTSLINKNYVDNLVFGVVIIGADTDATTNIALTGEQSINGVTTSSSRVFLHGQTNATQNGVWLTSSSSWVRASDAATAAQLLKLAVLIEGGTNKGQLWVNTNTSITLGTTSITFGTNSGMSYTNGTGLLLTGTAFSIDASYTASASQTGYLSSANWTTFNNKQNTLTFDSTPTSSSTNPVTSGGIFTALGTKQATGNYITTLTGDISASGPGSVVATLATVNANVGTYNNFTVNGKGLITAASTIAYLTSNQNITLTGAVTGSGATNIATTLANSIVGTSNLSASGTPSSTTYLRGDNTWATISAGSSYTFSTGLTNTSGTITVNPSQNITTLNNLTTNGVITTTGGTGTLSVISGTANPTASTYMLRDSNSNTFVNNIGTAYSTTATSSTPITLTAASAQQQYFTGTNNQTVLLPVVSTLIQGFQFIITNLSSQTVTVQSSGGNVVGSVAASGQSVYTCILVTGTTAASWNVLGSGNYMSITGNNNPSGVNTFSQRLVAAGNIITSAANGTAGSNFAATGEDGVNGNTFTNSTLLYGGGTQLGWRVLMNGQQNNSIGTSDVYSAFAIGSMPFTTTNSSTTKWATSLLIRPPVVTLGTSATLTNSTTVYIDGIPTIGTNKYALVIGDRTLTKGLMYNLSAKTAAYTLVTSDHTVTGDTTTAAFTFTLPTAVGNLGQTFIVKRINAGANVLTVGTTSSQTIDGVTTYALSAQYKYVVFISDGANWIIIGNN